MSDVLTGAGLVLGDRAARLVMLRNGPSGEAQANQWTEVLPPGAIRDGRVLDADAVRAVLTALARRADPMLASVPTWVGIHPQGSVAQSLDLAGLPAAVWEESLARVAEELGAGLVGGWEIRHRGNRTRALVVAAPREQVQVAADLARAAGFQVRGMELLPVPLVRATARATQPSGLIVYGLGPGGGRSVVAWCGGAVVLGGRMWPPAAGDAGLSLYPVPPEDLDLLADGAAHFAGGAPGFPVEAGLDPDAGLRLERLLATVGTDLPSSFDVDAAGLGLALVAAGRIHAPVDLLAAAGDVPPPPGATVVDLRTPAQVIDLTAPAAAPEGATGARAASGPSDAAPGGAVLEVAAGLAGGATAAAAGAMAPGTPCGVPQPAACVEPAVVAPEPDAVGGVAAAEADRTDAAVEPLPAAAPVAAPEAQAPLTAAAAATATGEAWPAPRRRPVRARWALFGAGTLVLGGVGLALATRDGSANGSGVRGVTRTTGRTVGTPGSGLPPVGTPVPTGLATSEATATSAGAATSGATGATGATATAGASVTSGATATSAATATSGAAATSAATATSGATGTSAATATTGAPATSTTAPETPGSTATSTTAPPATPPAPVPGTPTLPTAAAAAAWAATVPLPADASVTTPATAVLSDGRIVVSGAVTTVEEGRALLTTAAASVGTAQVQSTLVVNPAVAAQPPVTLDVAQDIRFAFDSAEVLPDYAAALDVQARLLTSQPGATITVAAFTDAIGSDTYNHELSLQRAQAVADHLIARGVDPHQIVTQALGEADPVGDNTSPEGRQLNRRVETRLDGALG